MGPRKAPKFGKTGCATRHLRSLTIVLFSSKVSAGTFPIPDALAGKAFQPFEDFLLLHMGSGDGIVLAMEQH
jgi:hypothetical protein